MHIGFKEFEVCVGGLGFRDVYGVGATGVGIGGCLKGMSLHVCVCLSCNGQLRISRMPWTQHGWREVEAKPHRCAQRIRLGLQDGKGPNRRNPKQASGELLQLS